MWTTLAGGVYMRPFCIILQEMMPMYLLLNWTSKLGY